MPDLPTDVTLPMTTLPKFNFGTFPTPSVPAKEMPQSMPVQQQMEVTRSPPGGSPAFTFSSPILRGGPDLVASHSAQAAPQVCCCFGHHQAVSIMSGLNMK